jgi:hypothetical protein
MRRARTAAKSKEVTRALEAVIGDGLVARLVVRTWVEIVLAHAHDRQRATAKGALQQPA